MVGFFYSSPHFNGDPKAIEKAKNKKTIIYPKGFNITWGNDKRYWRLPRQSRNLKESSAAAELLQVSWLEVTCWTDNVEIGKSYKVGFNVSMTAAAFGWKGCDVYIMAKIGKAGKFVYKKMCLDSKASDDQNKFNMPEDDLIITVKPPSSSPGDNRLYFGMYEVWSGKWKGGLKIHHAFVEKVGN
ncbi:protein PHLOEM PROTEIN 2-LIKE A9-like [Cucumis melo var. makuwa]|uniref:Protein PHLOEM PROTEIN 2-LIKE A9-like n=2 Tax=Cucumis melo TaxID=3656 RepID=A0A1S3CAI0_CUCME|nr:protein PHLOEM PROTEIN 2-LIKE A9-like [Cucumis melo]KAA0043222.1 protein PHLOEM PROTEIN 2-LIKE A9-like [Cucumis melo var. makuwa]TYK21342.1 protein PHLOEM PROTEIN 2-LIKE A9-like [Cucumis melo var. makuwa]